MAASIKRKVSPTEKPGPGRSDTGRGEFATMAQGSEGDGRPSAKYSNRTGTMGGGEFKQVTSTIGNK